MLFFPIFFFQPFFPSIFILSFVPASSPPRSTMLYASSFPPSFSSCLPPSYLTLPVPPPPPPPPMAVGFTIWLDVPVPIELGSVCGTLVTIPARSDPPEAPPLI
ncbi:hypothetical protein E2C01_101308 [Portunus trituberculatus]|uniref:Secreted protein n=1 Tax=Portunus trituberculatus TaxID=210409 RepID=A0A5B7KK51_PORTR|nr:hypothetical protein [Portunus trituberculatus]